MRCLKVDNDEVSIVYCQPVGNEIESLQFSPNYQKIAVGSNKVSHSIMHLDLDVDGTYKFSSVHASVRHTFSRKRFIRSL